MASIRDSISDMLTRIRNVQRANKVVVAMPPSKSECATAKVLEEKGHIEDFSVSADARPVLEIRSKYYTGRPVIGRVKHVSRPGPRIYKTFSEIPNVMSGSGIAIANISKGVMTGRKARSEGVGGELLCAVV